MRPRHVLMPPIGRPCTARRLYFVWASHDAAHWHSSVQRQYSWHTAFPACQTLATEKLRKLQSYPS